MKDEARRIKNVHMLAKWENKEVWNKFTDLSLDLISSPFLYHVIG